MKLHLDQNAQYHTIARYDARHVMIGPDRHEQNLIVMPQQLVPDWHQGDSTKPPSSAWPASAARSSFWVPECASAFRNPN